jgi:hypothetical protein
MTLIIEDGSQVVGANSYITTTELTTYATARGVTLTASAEVLIISAMDYIESLAYQGYKVSSTQALQWPRSYVYIDGYAFASDDIPQHLKDGLAQVAIAIDAGNGPLTTIGRAKKKVKAGPVEVEYADNATSVAVVRTISAALYKLLDGGGMSGNNIKVSRA